MTSTTTHETRIERSYSKWERNVIGQLVVRGVRGTCSCGWRAAAWHSTRTTEGWKLAERDADDHRAWATRIASH